MAKSEVLVPRARLRPRKGPERVLVGVRVTLEQKQALAKLGDGSMSIGFDRALALALAAQRTGTAW
jgi:hypothetical protein